MQASVAWRVICSMLLRVRTSCGMMSNGHDKEHVEESYVASTALCFRATLALRGFEKISLTLRTPRKIPPLKGQ